MEVCCRALGQGGGATFELSSLGVLSNLFTGGQLWRIKENEGSDSALCEENAFWHAGITEFGSVWLHGWNDIVAARGSLSTEPVESHGPRSEKCGRSGQHSTFIPPPPLLSKVTHAAQFLRTLLKTILLLHITIFDPPRIPLVCRTLLPRRLSLFRSVSPQLQFLRFQGHFLVGLVSEFSHCIQLSHLSLEYTAKDLSTILSTLPSRLFSLAVGIHSVENLVLTLDSSLRLQSLEKLAFFELYYVLKSAFLGIWRGPELVAEMERKGITLKFADEGEW